MNHEKKQKIKRLICHLPFVSRLAAYKTRHLPRIFMYHRFSMEDYSTGPIVSAFNFEWQLQQIKKGPWTVMSLSEYVHLRRKNLKIPPYTVILTVDDGYRDFYDVAFPLLHKYKLPATFFATTAFVNKEIWLWHDRLHYVIEKTKIKEVDVSFDHRTIRLRTATMTEKNETWQKLSDFVIEIPDEKKWQVVQLVEDKLEVDVPDIPPHNYAAASWSELKEMAENDIEIGGHTVTHPVLSQVKAQNLKFELTGPRRIMNEKIGIDIQTFCYPNGRDADINSTVLKIVREIGYIGAVQGSGLDFSNLYRLPRFGISNDRLDFLWKLYGFEQLLLRQ